MGTIQNSLTQALGTVGGTAALGKHLQQQKVANELAKIEAKDKAIDEFLDTNQKVQESVAETASIEKNIAETQADMDLAKEGTKSGYTDAEGYTK